MPAFGRLAKVDQFRTNAIKLVNFTDFSEFQTGSMIGRVNISGH
jgi:hypothetical protein